MEQIKEYQRNRHSHVEQMLPEYLPWQAYFYHPTGRQDIGCPRIRLAQHFVWYGMGHDSICELVEEEECGLRFSQLRL